MMQQAVQSEGNSKSRARQINGPSMNAVCLVIRCELFPKCFGECCYPFQKSRVERELESSGHIIFCTFIVCGVCGTVNGHSNCSNRFGASRINHL